MAMVIHNGEKILFLFPTYTKIDFRTFKDINERKEIMQNIGRIGRRKYFHDPGCREGFLNKVPEA